MGIIPERTTEEQEAHNLSLSRGFGETTQHVAAIKTTAPAQTREEWLDSLPKDPQTGRNEVQEYRLRYGAY